MGENIYSNPSGFTELPWEFSVKWFKDRILHEVAISEEYLRIETPKIGYRTCYYCGAPIPSAIAGTCQVCYTAYKQAPGQKKTQTSKLLSDLETQLIDADSQRLGELDESAVATLHNFLVDCLRSACLRDLSTGNSSVRVRDGLEVTVEWDVHFKNLFKVQPKILLWPALKHSMLGNPLAGEILEWQNIGGQPQKSSTKTKVAGAAAVGLLAGFLFG